MAQNTLLDFLQGASNSAASNVSAPIDGLNWLLRKAGMPVSDKPFLGSDWMAQKGLTVQPQNKMAGLLGESFGGVAPIVAAAKAPQIARGLLQAGDNLAAPTALNGQAGAVYVGKKKIADNAYHGTGTDFQGRFDPDMVGSANADQHGSYWLTSDWGHARGYSVAADRNNLTKPIVKEANVFMKNPMEVDAMQTAKNIADDVGIDQPTTWEEASELLQYNQWLNDTVWDAKKLGHDGLIVRNTGDAPGTAGGLADHFAIFNANRARFMK